MPRKNPKFQKEIEFRGTTYRGRAAKLVRKNLAPAHAAWERGIGSEMNHPRQAPGSTKI